ncbi:MAG: thioesterase family protein [Planctomycetota bacterium]|nr:thioesterase family protein [Planctomycetota bacterium]
MPAFVHEQQIRVRYADTDQYGVVYYANYLVYFEVGRTEFMRSRGQTYRSLEESGVYLAVTEATCRYRAPLQYDDQVLVLTWISDIGKTRMTFEYGIHRLEGDERRQVAEGFTTLACITGNGKPRRIPDGLRALAAEAMESS